jgi:opacity protein-like surface antigen
MGRLLFALGLAGLASQAFAADLTVLQPPTPYVPAYPTYVRWEGFYVGGQLAAGEANADFTHATQPLLALALRNLTLENEQRPSQWQVLGSGNAKGTGFGAYAGYNLQFDDAVVGWDFSYTHTSFNVQPQSFPIGRLTPVLSNGRQYSLVLSGSGSMPIEDVATLRARLGWVAGYFMPYATLGLAIGRADPAVSVTCLCQEINPGPPQSVIDFSFTQTQARNFAILFGFAGGGGFEVALTRNLIGRLEYEYIQWSPVTQITSHINIGRLGLGYKF